MSTDTSERRQKVVMALGIATIILFSANLLTVLAKHFWPEQNLPFVSEQEVAVEAPNQFEYEVRVYADRPHEHRKHRVIIRAPKVRVSDAVSHIVVDELDRDIAEMEAAAERLERELSIELESSMRQLELQLQEAKEHMARRQAQAEASDT